MLSTFGAENVLIVSNSAGSSKDSLSLQVCAPFMRIAVLSKANG